MSADLIAAFSSRALSDCIYVSMLAASCNNDALKSFVKSIVQEHMTELTRSHPQLPQSMLTDNSLTSAATSTNAAQSRTASIRIERSKFCNSLFIEKISTTQIVAVLARKLEQLRESVFTAHVACGWPKTIDALSAFREAIGTNVDVVNALSNKLPDTRSVESMSKWQEHGMNTFSAVYGERANTVRAVLRRGAPSLEQSVLVCTYGCVMSDDSVITLEQRELALLGALRVVDADAQAASHSAAVQRLFGTTAAQLTAIQNLSRTLAIEQATKLIEKYRNK